MIPTQMHLPREIAIAGLHIRLHDAAEALAELDAVFVEFGQRAEAFKADGRNPHLCRAGCSHCCKSGAVFAVTLVESVRWALAIAAAPPEQQDAIRNAARLLKESQDRVFNDGRAASDVPGQRDEHVFSARVSALNRTSPACPVLSGDLCRLYDDRPLLCRAYGFPVDAFGVESSDAIVFRSLCRLYDGMQLVDFVRAKDLRARIAAASRRIGGSRDWGRFTSLEAILAELS
jgi:Fe-S-cluster containining protein